jgi:hypothetical protein
MKRLIGSNPSSSPWIYVSPESSVHRTIRSSHHGDRSFFLFRPDTAVAHPEKIYIYPGSRSTSRKSIAVATHPSSSSSLQNLPLAYLVADLKATCIKTLDQHRQNDPPAVNRSRLLIYYSFPLLLFLPVLFYHLSHTWIDRIFLVSLLALVLSSPRRLPVLVSFLVLIIDSPRTRLNSGRIRR